MSACFTSQVCCLVSTNTTTHAPTPTCTCIHTCGGNIGHSIQAVCYSRATTHEMDVYVHGYKLLHNLFFHFIMQYFHYLFENFNTECVLIYNMLLLLVERTTDIISLLWDVCFPLLSPYWYAQWTCTGVMRLTTRLMLYFMSAEASTDYVLIHSFCELEVYVPFQ